MLLEMVVNEPSADMILSVLELDRAAAVPLHRQVYARLREAILEGRISGGTRLPATRTLAEELSISRNTVVNAFDQLLAEGYIEGRVGAGTYVARVLPDEFLSSGDRQPGGHPRPASERAQRRVSRRIAALRSISPPQMPWSATQGTYGTPRAFRPGLPAVGEFPFEAWSRAISRRSKRPPDDLLSYGSPAGYGPLREAIAAYLKASRGVRCGPDQVIVVAGSQQALDLSARVLLDPGDAAWIEDPGYLGARGALLASGARIVPVPVDGEGLRVDIGAERCPDARMIYVSPSCQYPMGVTMSLARRLALLEWAAQSGAWVLEDDYNSEYRYAGRPLASLQGLDRDNRVIYIGSFSKVLFPALRMGYLVVPPDLVNDFLMVRSRTDMHSPTLEQAALADFMEEGFFSRHIRRMRILYAERQARLVEAARRELAGLLDIRPAEAGMHLVGYLPGDSDDQRVAHRVLAAGIYTPPLSAYAIEPLEKRGVLLGYTGVSETEIDEGVRRMARALVSAKQRPPATGD